MKKLILLIALLSSVDAMAARLTKRRFTSSRASSASYDNVVRSNSVSSEPVALIKSFIVNAQIRNLFQGCTATTESQIPSQQVLAYVEGPGFSRGTCIPFYCDADLNNNNVLDVDELADRSVYTRVERCDSTHSTAGGYSLTGINAEAACLGNGVLAPSLSALENITIWVEDYSITGSGNVRTGNCYWNTISNQQAVFSSHRLECAREDSVTPAGSSHAISICRKYVPSEQTTYNAGVQNEQQTGGADGVIDGILDIDCQNAYATAWGIGIYSDAGRKQFADAGMGVHFQFTPREGVANDSCSAQIDTQAALARQRVCAANPSLCP